MAESNDPEAAREAAENPNLLLGSLLAITDETDNRRIRFSTPHVIRLETDVVEDGTGLIVPGSVTLILAASGYSFHSDILTYTEIPNQTAGKGIRHLARLAQMSLQSFQGAMAANQASLASVDHIAELRYRGMVLGSKIVLDHGEAYSDVFPYTGGHLDAEEFVLVDYYNDERVEPLAGVIVVCPPRLSDIEQEALEQVPSDVTEVNISVMPLLIPVTVARAAVATCPVYRDAARRAAQVLARGRGGGGPIVVNLSGYAEEMLRQLTPEASARELLRLRRELLTKRLLS